jgi:Ubiquitin-2 like Rad60 SUMO-like
MAAVASMNGEGGLWLPDSRGATKEEKIEKWWEVNRKHDPPLSRGATPLVERVMRVHGMSEMFAKRVLKGYRQFMELKSVMNDWQGQKLSPPIPISQMWEQHLIDNLNYTDDCFLLFGRVIGHDPDAVLDLRSTRDRINTTKIAFQARYGDDLDPEVWIYGLEEVDRVIIDEPHVGGGVHFGRGRLPVAGIAVGAVNALREGPETPHHPHAHVHQQQMHMAQQQMQQQTLSPRGRSLVVSSEEDESPIMDRQGRTKMAAQGPASPRNRAASKTPPKSPTGNDPITIFLRDQSTGEETYFSLRYRSTLRIVFTVFAERKGLSQDSLKFSFNGQSLTGYETPYSLGLEDRARIDVSISSRRN